MSTYYTSLTFNALQKETGCGTNRYPIRKNTKAAEDLLRDCSIVLSDHGIEVILLFGSLLGYYRSNSLIPHDVDMDIGIIGEGNLHKVHNLINNGSFFKKNILAIKDREFSLYRDNFYVDIYPFITTDNVKYISRLGYPQYYLTNDDLPLQKIKFLDINLSTVRDIEKYLTSRYGENWTEPKENHGAKF